MKLLSIVLLLVVTTSLAFAQAKGNKPSREQRGKDGIEQFLRRITDEWTQVDVTHDRRRLDSTARPESGDKSF